MTEQEFLDAADLTYRAGVLNRRFQRNHDAKVQAIGKSGYRKRVEGQSDDQMRRELRAEFGIVEILAWLGFFKQLIAIIEMIISIQFTPPHQGRNEFPLV